MMRTLGTGFVALLLLTTVGQSVALGTSRSQSTPIAETSTRQPAGLDNQRPGQDDASGTTLVVAQDGSGSFASVQAAIDAVPSNNGERVTILIKPGIYREVVNVPRSKPFITLRGVTGDPRDTVITYDNASGTLKSDGTPYGTSGSATATISGHDFQAFDLTFENAFDEQANAHMRNRQAVAVKTEADRLIFDNVRFLGNQDTLYVNSPSTTEQARQYFRRCYIEGDVDFIFGRGTAVFDHCVLMALDRGSSSNNGYLTAASTPDTQQHGFLIINSRIVSNAPDQTFYLGRPWHPGGDPRALGQVTIRDTWLDSAIKAAPWSDMSGFSWRDARFAEYRNHGPGAVEHADRPQLSDEQAAAHTILAYLAGTDGWSPAPPGLAR